MTHLSMSKHSSPFPSIFDEFFNTDTFFVKPLSSLLDQLIKQNDQLKKEYGATYFEKLSYPKMDIIQSPNDNKLTVIVDVPGIKKEDIDIKLEIDPEFEGEILEGLSKLSISSKKRETITTDNDIWLLRELKCSGFNRSIFLNNKIVDVEDYQIKLENGVLQIDFKLLLPQKEKETTIPKVKKLEIK